MCDCARPIAIGTGLTAKKVKSLYLHDEQTDVVTYFDITGGRTKFNQHFNADLQLALSLDKVFMYSIAFSNKYRLHNLTSIFRVPKVLSTSTPALPTNIYHGICL